MCVGFFSHYRFVSLCFFLVGLMSTAEFFGRSCWVSSLLTLVCLSVNYTTYEIHNRSEQQAYERTYAQEHMKHCLLLDHQKSTELLKHPTELISKRISRGQKTKKKQIPKIRCGVFRSVTHSHSLTIGKKKHTLKMNGQYMQRIDFCFDSMRYVTFNFVF